MHFHHRRETCHIAVIVGKHAPGHGRAGRRLCCENPGRQAPGQIGADKGKTQPCEVTAATGTPYNHIGIFTRHFHLQQGLAPDHRLVQHDVVKHATQAVIGVIALGRHFHRLRDGNTQAPGRIGKLRQNGAAGFGLVAGAGDNLPTVGLYHATSIGFLVKADLNHEYLHGYTHRCAGKGKCGTPLASAGLGDDMLDARFAIVVGLGDRGVQLV